MKRATAQFTLPDGEEKSISHIFSQSLQEAFSAFPWQTQYENARLAGQLDGKYGPCMVVEYREGRHSLTIQSISPAKWEVTMVLPSRIAGCIPGIIVHPFRLGSTKSDEVRAILSRFTQLSPAHMRKWMTEKKYEGFDFDTPEVPASLATCPVSRKGIIAACALLPVCVALLVTGYHYLKHAKASQGWPSTKGIITSPRDYEYTVEGQQYINRQISYKGDSSYSTGSGGLAKGPTTVYYDPQQPSRSVLQPGYDKSSYVMFVFGIIGLTVFCIGVVQMTLNRIMSNKNLDHIPEVQ